MDSFASDSGKVNGGVCLSCKSIVGTTSLVNLLQKWQESIVVITK